MTKENNNNRYCVTRIEIWKNSKKNLSDENSQSWELSCHFAISVCWAFQQMLNHRRDFGDVDGYIDERIICNQMARDVLSSPNVQYSRQRGKIWTLYEIFGWYAHPVLGRPSTVHGGGMVANVGWLLVRISRWSRYSLPYCITKL